MKSVKTQVKDLMLDSMCYNVVQEKVSCGFFCRVVDKMKTNKLFSLYVTVKNEE